MLLQLNKPSTNFNSFQSTNATETFKLIWVQPKLKPFLASNRIYVLILCNCITVGQDQYKCKARCLASAATSQDLICRVSQQTTIHSVFQVNTDNQVIFKVSFLKNETSQIYFIKQQQDQDKIYRESFLVVMPVSGISDVYKRERTTRSSRPVHKE